MISCGSVERENGEDRVWRFEKKVSLGKDYPLLGKFVTVIGKNHFPKA
jgi:hypothetical protein